MKAPEGVDGVEAVEGVETVLVPTGDGRVLDALVSGPAEGTVLVLHTGTPCGLVPLPTGLDPGPMGVRTVLYARPGYGRSTPRPGRTVADGAADTAAVLDALGVDTFLNVGYSGGGPYALACDALLAERCLGTAVIAGIAPYTETGGSSPVRSWYEGDDDNRRALDGDVAGFRQAVDAFLADLGQVDEEAIAAGATSEAERRFFARGWGAWVASYLRAAGASGGDGAADDLLASLRDWCVPLADVRRVTIWHGAEDQLVPLFHGEWLRDHLPHADLRRLDDEGHVSIAGRLPDVVAGLAGDHSGRRPVG